MAFPVLLCLINDSLSSFITWSSGRNEFTSTAESDIKVNPQAEKKKEKKPLLSQIYLRIWPTKHPRAVAIIKNVTVGGGRCSDLWFSFVTNECWAPLLWECRDGCLYRLPWQRKATGDALAAISPSATRGDTNSTYNKHHEHFRCTKTKPKKKPQHTSGEESVITVQWLITQWIKDQVSTMNYDNRFKTEGQM